MHDGTIGRRFGDGPHYRQPRLNPVAPLWFSAAMIIVAIEAAVAAGGTATSWLLTSAAYIGGGAFVTIFTRRLK